MPRLSAVAAVVTILCLAAPAAASPNGSVSGTVTSSATAAPISGVFITLTDANTGITVGSAITDAGGAYTISNVATGTYTALTTNSAGFIDQIYGGIVCLTCASPLGGATFSVTAPNTTDHVDFALAPGGSISGNLKDQAGTAITSGVAVQVYDAHGNNITQATPDGTGAYATTKGLPTGTYYVRSTNSIGYSDTLYNAIPCSGCPVFSGTPIAVTAGTATSNINLVLQAAGNVSGHVQAVEDNSPLAQAFVSVVGANGIRVVGMQTDAGGNYNLGSIPPGTYYVTADASTNGRIVQLYNGKACQGCSVTLGTPVTVTAGATVSGIDFSLALGGSISGTITNASTHAAIPVVIVLAVGASGQTIEQANTAIDGTYTFKAMAPGAYFIKTLSLGAYTDQLHATPVNLPCASNGCAAALGTAVTVAGTSAVTGIDFALQPASGGGGGGPTGTPAAIKGTVTDGTTGLSGIIVSAYPVGSPFFPAGVAVTDVTGAYTIGSLQPGNYILQTTNQIGYVNQIYSGHPCVFCNPSSGDAVTILSGVDTLNINFTLTLGAKISGRVTDTAGNPLPSTLVLVETRDGLSISNATTDAAGRYSAIGLPAGNYVVVTAAPLFYVNKLYNDIQCPRCYAQTGTVVALTAGGSATNVDFSLPFAGSITGTVTDTSGNPLAGVSVSTSGGGTATTNGAGQYVIPGVGAGSYTLSTLNALGYIDQTSASVAVVLGSTTTGVDFHLASGGRISGTVTAADGSPLQNVTVRAVRFSGGLGSSTQTLSDGSYVISGLAAGTYFVSTQNLSGFVDEVHASPSDLACLFCSASQIGAGVPVSTGQTATVNFTLALGGAISGTVTNTSGAPLSGVTVSATVPGTNAGPGASTFTGSDGTYSIAGVPAGAFAVTTLNGAGYIDQVYNGHVCRSCNTASGDPVSVTAGATHTGVNFTLSAGGPISGSVKDASGGPIASATIGIYGMTGTTIAFALSDGVGHFSSAGLPDGVYYVNASSAGYVSTVWPNCPGCTPTSGGQVKLQGGVATPAAVNITLPAGGRISGRLTDAVTGTPLAGQVFVYQTNGTIVGQPSTDANGFYAVDSLPSGSYYAYASASGYIPVVYPNVTCFTCSVVGQGTAVTVTSGTETSGIDFALRVFTGTGTGAIAGTVKDAATGQPIAGVTVLLEDGQSNVGGVSTTDSSGHYTIGGLPAGTFYAGTFSGSLLGYVDVLFGGTPCAACFSVVSSAPIIVATGATTSNVDFSLSLAGRVTGRVTAGGAGAGDVIVELVTPTGAFAGFGFSGVDGRYGITGVAPGTYFVDTYNSIGLIDQVYGGAPCPYRCVLNSGTPVTVSAGATASGIDFDLAAGGRISGHATDTATGAALNNVEIDVYNAVGAVVGFLHTDTAGFYVTEEGLTPGNYFVVGTSSSFAGSAYIPQAYNGIACAGCSPTSGTPVPVTAGATTANIDLALTSGSVIAGTVREIGTGLPVPEVTVNVYDTQARLVTSTTADFSGHYVTTGLPVGTYFVKTLGGTAYVDSLYDTGVCLACDVTRGAAIAVDGSTQKTGINLALLRGGSIAGAVTSTSGGAPIANVTVRIYNSAGTFLGQATTIGNGTYASPALPPGNYFVRTANTVGFVDKLYNGITCAPPCSLLQGTRVTVVTAGKKSGVDFALDQGGVLAGFVRDETTGFPIIGATVSIFDHATHALVAVTDRTDDSGDFLISVPVGTYDLQANPIDGYRPFVSSSLRSAAALATVTVSAGSQTTSIAIDLVQCTPIGVGPASLPLAASGQLYSAALTASGGTGPYTFSVIDGALNNGLTLSSAGLISGAPQFPGAGSFTVAASDAAQCGGTRKFTLTACSFFLSTTTDPVLWIAGNGSVDFAAATPDCPWTAVSNVPWITVTSAASGTGSGSITFSYGINVGAVTRTGTITVGGQTYTIAQASSVSQAPFGQLELPADGATGLVGAIAISGWALDDVQVFRVTVCRDALPGEPTVTTPLCGGRPSVYIGNATLVDGARPDVAAAFPSAPFNSRAGFGYLLLSNMLPGQGNGTFVLHVYALDFEGNVTLLGDRTVTFANASADKPFGAIDTPGQGDTISGTSYVNFGWALTQSGKTIPTSGSTFTIYVDGVPSGGVDYGHFRGDIASLFPGLANTSGAIGFHVFDTTTWTNGVHAIAWGVTDDAGKSEGIGSRFFTVNNTLASLRAQPAEAAFTPSSSVAASSVLGRVLRPGDDPAVQFRTGFSESSPLLELKADPDGHRVVIIGQQDRLVLQLNDACGAVTGKLLTDGDPWPLPSGSTLTPGGTFYWQTAPAFLGTYHLEFSVPSCGGGTVTVPVDVQVIGR